VSLDPVAAPYLAVVLLGFLPSEVWRWLAVALAHRIDEDSEVFRFVRSLATALLVGVVYKIVAAPARELAAAPLWARGGAFVFAAAAFFGFGRSVFAAILAGEAAVIAEAWWWG